MSIATVHYLSMNAASGQITLPASPIQDVSQSYTFSSLAASTSHSIAWGDTQTTAGVSSNASGVLTQSHTYANPGTFTIVVTETTGGRRVLTESVTIAA